MLIKWAEDKIAEKEEHIKEACTRPNNFDCGYDRGYRDALLMVLHKVEEE
jgi:hypothetical protein